jgi:hypothetical protein
VPSSPSRQNRGGTGDAVAAALASVPDDAAEILVLSGDVPLVTGEDLQVVLDAPREDDAAIALATVFAADRHVWAGSFAASSGLSSGSSRRATPSPRSWPATRSTRVCTSSTRRGCAAGSRP